jgi:hypothetical protein
MKPFHQKETATMSRSRHRLADFEARSVQIIAACTLGLASMSAVHASTSHRVGAHTPTQSTASAPALPSPTRPLPSSVASSRTDRR